MNSAFMWFTQRKIDSHNSHIYLWECNVCKALVITNSVVAHFEYHGIA